jgi:hypothetical protein
MTIDSLYTPGATTTDGIALFCAAAMAMLIAVNCAEPSRATVTAVGLDVAEAAEVVDAALEDRVDEEDAIDERLEAVLEATVGETAEPEVDDVELDWLTVEGPDVPV